MFLITADSPAPNIRTGLSAHLRRLEVREGLFVRAEATNHNRLSSTFARLRRCRDCRGRQFTAFKVDGGFKVYRLA